MTNQNNEAKSKFCFRKQHTWTSCARKLLSINLKARISAFSSDTNRSLIRLFSFLFLISILNFHSQKYNLDWLIVQKYLLCLYYFYHNLQKKAKFYLKKIFISIMLCFILLVCVLTLGWVT